MLGGTAGLIFVSAVDGGTEDDVVERVAATAGLDPAAVRPDVLTFLDHLVSRGLPTHPNLRADGRMARVPVPQYHPSPRELDDLELLTSGALLPVTGFNEPGSPVTLALPAELADAEAVELVDPEGLPLALVAADGSVEPLTHAQFGPFRRLYLTPAQAREHYAGATFVPVDDALDEDQLRRCGASRAGSCWSPWSATVRRRSPRSGC